MEEFVYEVELQDHVSEMVIEPVVYDFELSDDFDI